MSTLDEALQLIEPVRPDIADILRRVDIWIVPWPCVVEFPNDPFGTSSVSVDMLTNHLHGVWDQVAKRMLIPYVTAKTAKGLAYVLVHEGQHVLDDAHGVLGPVATFKAEVRGLAAQAQIYDQLFADGIDPTDHIQWDAEIIHRESMEGSFLSVASLMYRPLYQREDAANRDIADSHQCLTFDSQPTAEWLR